MEYTFKTDDPAKALADIKNALEGRKLNDIVDFDLDKGDLTVTIKKMGKSTLLFSHSLANGQLAWKLTKEKIALTHRPLKQGLMDKFQRIIENAGGTVSK